MSWQVFISLQVVLVAFATIITRLLARDRKLANAGLVITAGWFIVLYALGLLILPQLGNVDYQAFHKYAWRFAGGGVAFALMNILFFYTMRYLDAAIGTIIGTTSALFVVFGASVLLHENLSHLQILGTWLLLISVVYGMLATRHTKNKEVHRRLVIGIGLALASSFFYAIASLNEKFLLNHISTGSYILFGWGAQTAAALTAAILLQRRQFKILLRPRIAGWVGTLGVLRVVSGYCFMLSLVKSNNVGLVTVISNFKLIIIIFLGAWLLHEHSRIKQKVVAAAGASAALCLLFWR